MILVMKRSITVTMIVFALQLLLVFASSSPARLRAFAASDTQPALPFASAEKLVYEGEFTRSLLRGIDVADLSFSYTYLPAQEQFKSGGNSQAAMRFTAEAVSKGVVSKLFGITFRQRVESTVEPGTFSVLNTSKLDEQGKRKRTSVAVFDHEVGKVVFTELDPNDVSRPPRVVTTELNGRVLDIASAFYYLRTLKLEPGMTFEIVISDTGQLFQTPIKVVKRERMKTTLGEINTLRVVPELFGDGHLIRGKGDITIWFSDDVRHIPVRAKINNNLGRLDIKLKSFNNAIQ